jgi:uncharacterized protein
VARVARWLGVVLSLALVGGLAAAWLYVDELLYPPKTVCDRATWVHCGTPADLGLDFEEVSFTGSHGLTLRGWLVPGARPALGSVVLVHGRTANRRELMRWVPALHAAGIDVLTFDQRGAGASDAAPNTMGRFESEDVLAAARWLLERGGGPVAAFGASLGGAAVILAMSREPRIAAGVVEAGFTTLEEQIADRLWALSRVPRPLGALVVDLFELRAGIRASDVAPVDVVSGIAPRPLMVILGEADLGYRKRQTLALFEAARQPKKLWRVPGAGHVNAWNVAGPKVEDEVVGFLADALTRRPSPP